MTDDRVALVARRWIRAPAPRLFEAWTRPEHLVHWWGPPGARCPRAEVDGRVAGRFRIDNELASGERLSIVGVFLEWSPPHRLVYTWSVAPTAELATPAAHDERVTVRFEGRPGGTEVIVVHERIADAASRDGHEVGWVGCLEGLARWAELKPTTP